VHAIAKVSAGKIPPPLTKGVQIQIILITAVANDGMISSSFFHPSKNLRVKARVADLPVQKTRNTDLNQTILGLQTNHIHLVFPLA